MKRLHKIQDKERVSFSFPLFSKKPLFILAIFCFILFSSGCTDDSGNEAEVVEVTKDVNYSGSGAELVEVTNLIQIDEALTKGPVVLKLGSKGCIPCKEQEEVLSELLPIYQDSASIMLIDIKEYPEFATKFGVRVIPDTCIITGIEDGKYMYMWQDGSKSSERASARFLGVVDKETLSETLEKAIESRNTGE
ncbi:MAG: thioredoxin family protein [Methanosarcina sp.]|uniref:thioredoxin family protein n=1 Tax=Methanosarcina sp. TaxID=2213 RepID=UPI00262E12B9|nr:thioredoxin family protein [Methanosarcina sp.]MDD3248393.1 thioredoxin family protein [Methanosarcina sp.]MDD4248653.1 thioredoxin family protein [Methanosarcina sp.]